jgi:acyl carrier protein
LWFRQNPANEAGIVGSAGQCAGGRSQARGADDERVRGVGSQRFCVPGVVGFRGLRPARLPRLFDSEFSRTNNVASVKERVIDIVAEQLGVDKDKITMETSFVNDLGADSLDTVELVMELEEEFDINIPDDAAEKIQTVGQAVEYIESTQS